VTGWLGTADAAAVAFDLDGVLYDGDTPIAGAVETVAAVRAAGLAVRFVTNTSSRGRRLIADKLAQLGFTTAPAEVVCPTWAAAAWLRQRTASAALFVPPDAAEDFADIRQDDAGPDTVVVGDLGERWTFPLLNRVFRLVHEAGAELVGLGRSRYWRGPSGLQLDVGPMLAAIEHATGRRARVFGKPERDYFDTLVRDLGVPAARVVMVGDDVESDVSAAMAAGLRGVLVRTGKFRPQDLEGPVRPDHVLDSVAALIT
jgi:phospholysine phosphohistidine inorganic pyrophosphate phosphatase